MMRTKLYPHQQEALGRVLNEPFFPLFMDMGTGKTLVAIKAIEERYKRKQIHKVIIFAPNTLLLNWEMEIQKFMRTPHYLIKLNQKNKKQRDKAYQHLLSKDHSSMNIKQLKSLGYSGTKKNILKIVKYPLLILLVNFEKARVMFKDLRKYKPHMLIVDESHKLRNINTTSKRVYNLTRTTKYRILLTGTPVCNGYEDLFMQYKILNEDILGSKYKEFENTYIRKGGYMNYEIVGYKNQSTLKKIIAKNSFQVKIEDCIKLPPSSFRFLSCELSPQAEKVYKEMKQDMLTSIDNLSKTLSRSQIKQICRTEGIVYSPRESYISLLLKVHDFINTSSCDLAITQAMRLHQIAGGFLALDSGEIVDLGSNKLEILKGEIKQTPTIIFCQYIPEIEKIVNLLSQQGLRVESFRKDKDRLYNDFHKGLIDVLVLQMSSGSVGLNLQQANKLIFYSMNSSAEDYFQAIARIKRSGQQRPIEIVHIFAEDTIDLDIYDRVKTKRILAEKLFTNYE